jgi:uncharacterized damage-inducible protein DinB
MLRAYLDYQRQTLSWKCSGLTAEQLREQAVPPSTLSLLGLLRHMTEVEGGWFVRGISGQPFANPYSSKESPDDDFNDVSSQDTGDAYEQWQLACDRSRDIEAGVQTLDDWRERRHGDESFQYSLRWLMLHLIEEYARHNGHADLIRERIDGAKGE